MNPQDPYMLKAVEYLACVASLGLFFAFWQFVNGEPGPRRAAAWSGRLVHFFRLPERVFFHPGHAWARVEEPDVVAVGVDDFAQQLLGPIEAIRLPAPGTAVTAGAPAWSVEVDSKAVAMVAPVSGTVRAVNRRCLEKPALLNRDPYGQGWLIKVQVPHNGDGLGRLLTGGAAAHWMEQVASDLEAEFTARHAAPRRDGRPPDDGFAHALAHEHWDAVARKYLAA